jgi:hypothetical protein
MEDCLKRKTKKSGGYSVADLKSIIKKQGGTKFSGFKKVQLCKLLQDFKSDTVPVKHLTLSKMKEMLQSYKLPVSGNKSVLSKRIEEYRETVEMDGDGDDGDGDEYDSDDEFLTVSPKKALKIEKRNKRSQDRKKTRLLSKFNATFDEKSQELINKALKDSKELHHAKKSYKNQFNAIVKLSNSAEIKRLDELRLLSRELTSDEEDELDTLANLVTSTFVKYEELETLVNIFTLTAQNSFDNSRQHFNTFYIPLKSM